MIFPLERYPPRPFPLPVPSIPDLMVTELPGYQSLDSTVSDVSTFFRMHYGNWSQNPRLRRPGGRMRMSNRLIEAEIFMRRMRGQAQIVRALRLEITNNDRYCGHLISCNWVTPEGVKVCWITQMLVKTEMRSHGIAEAMLYELKRAAGTGAFDVFGIVSSHPHAIMALCRACGHHSVEEMDLHLLRTQAAPCMAYSPVRYIREGKMNGSLWGLGDTTGVATLDTTFLVERQGMREAMRSMTERGRQWPLGGLPEGHEWVCMVKADWRELEPAAIIAALTAAEAAAQAADAAEAAAAETAKTTAAAAAAAAEKTNTETAAAAAENAEMTAPQLITVPEEETS